MIANVGGQLTLIALAAAVVIILGATPIQAGALRAVECGIIRFSRRSSASSSTAFRAGRS